MWTRHFFHVSSAASVLFLLVSPASTLAFQHFPRDLVERAVDDRFTPHQPPFTWYALGDSYTAAPGAGDLDPSNEDDCIRSVGSYALQLSQDWVYNGQNNLRFIACTGAVSDDVINKQLREISSDPPPDLVVLTLGGNDIGFANIAKACLVGLIGSGDCDALIAEAVVGNPANAFWGKLEQVYDGVFDQMPNDMHYQVFHMGYTKFFNTAPESTWCNGQTFGKIGLSGLNPPKLTFDLRNKLNQLTDDWNRALRVHLLGYAQRKLTSGRWNFQRIWYVQYDSIAQPQYSFGGHLFCEPGVENSKFQDPSTWIYGVWGKQRDSTTTDDADSANEVDASAFATINSKTCRSDPKYNDDDAFGWDCDMAVYYADPTTDHNVTTIPGLDFVRSFHPKTAGFTRIKEYLANTMQRFRQAPAANQCINAPPTDLDDDTAITSGFPQSICADSAGTLATALSGAGSPTSASASPQVTTWNDPYGPVPAGHFSWFILPRWEQPIVDDPDTATFTIFTQDGDKQTAITHGPLEIDCDDEDKWQGLNTTTTGLPFEIVFQAGHLCATGIANNNYDGLHVKYANLYVDVPDKINDKSCTKHDNGVSCNYPTNPP